IHIGDTRAYRLSEGRLERLTTDHIAGRGDLAHLLNRAIGFEDFARFDYATVGLRQHDRLLICSDGVHGVLADHRLQVLLSEGTYRLAFVREAWGAARVRSLWIGEIVELPAERQSRLYSVMPLYEGETLEQRLNRSPQLSLSEGIGIATKLARAVATLHRAGIIHRDIKPDNVILLK